MKNTFQIQKDLIQPAAIQIQYKKATGKAIIFVFKPKHTACLSNHISKQRN